MARLTEENPLSRDANTAYIGPWDWPSLTVLRGWDPVWAEMCVTVSTNPWKGGVLPLKEVELISLAVNAACTNLNGPGTRRHIRGALDAGASREEVLLVLKMASLLGIHTCSFAAPIFLEEAKAAGVETAQHAKSDVPTPACDEMRAAGLWNKAWDPSFELDPVWTEQFIAAAMGIYIGGVVTPKFAELLSIAFDASYTHMYPPGTRHHIQAALQAGATPAEIMEVLKICVSQGVQACNRGVLMLDEELAGNGKL
jgi:alkylhydroperoxidase/carboxymuconolactone decarboxylase family protein YurZ